MTIITETAYAKINLALHVRGRRSDGYHEIETLFAFVGDGDRVVVEPADRLMLTITGPFSQELEADESNLVLRAARAMRDHFDIAAGAQIRLEKRLPIAAGLGGGSADAAAVARALNHLWGIEAEERLLAATIADLGADVPACVASRTMIGRGTGAALGESGMASPFSGRPVLLVNPLRPCSTAEVYRRWDGIDRGPMGEDRASWRNDLTRGAVGIVPEIGELLFTLSQMPGAGQVSMSGSGATCFALFADEASCAAAHREMQQNYRHWWAMAGRLR